MVLKTTILLRDDVYSLLVSVFGKKNISKGVNEVVYEHLVKERRQKSMYGVDKHLAGMSLDDVRDHYERDF
ncbi:MAG: hypothetical protein NTY90_04615 [Candidatus Micrarchaeota archaeon]|nr:hypothetical protein [Candidatus Micrarchaeota archaeon]